MYKKVFLLMVLFLCSVQASLAYPIELNLNYTYVPGEISPECRYEWDQFMSMQPEEHISSYCSAVDLRILFLLIIVFVLWVCEPIVKNKLEKTKYLHLIYIYKWLGLGILFLSIYLSLIRGGFI
jgi:hypothetical protein